MDKNEFRKLCLKKLKKNSLASNKIYLDFLVAKKLDKLIKEIKPKNILFYSALKIEPNLEKLIKKYRVKTDIFLPFIEEKSFKMVKYRLPLKQDSFGVFSPKNSFLKQKDIDMIIVPVVGVDGNFKRVGFGKGMYDRFYEKLQKKPIVVFVQRQKCFTKELLCDWHDIPCDFYITP